MFTVFGIACVMWTGLEVHRLMRRSEAEHLAPAPAGARAHSARPRANRFAAWDDRGRPITVEDLGRS